MSAHMSCIKSEKQMEGRIMSCLPADICTTFLQNGLSININQSHVNSHTPVSFHLLPLHSPLSCSVSLVLSLSLTSLHPPCPPALVCRARPRSCARLSPQCQHGVSSSSRHVAIPPGTDSRRGRSEWAAHHLQHSRCVLLII